MNSSEFRQKINNIRPSYVSERKQLLEVISNKGGTKSEYAQFGPFYQSYMYAFFLGYKLGQRVPLTGKTDNFFAIGLWQPKSMVDFILMLLFSNLEEMKEWNEFENMEEDEIDQKVKHILIAIEEYSNAGLLHLQDKYNAERYEFQDPFAFVNIMTEII